MGRLFGCVFQAGINVSGLKIGKILENLLARHSAGEHFKDMTDGDAHPANARTPAANLRINRNLFHGHANRIGQVLEDCNPRLQPGFSKNIFQKNFRPPLVPTSVTPRAKDKRRTQPIRQRTTQPHNETRS